MKNFDTFLKTIVVMMLAFFIFFAETAISSDVNSNKYGATSLMTAAQSRNAQEVKRLLQMGADINAISDTGYTALMLAAWNCDDEIVQILINNGADVSITQLGIKTALDYAKIQGFENTAKILSANKNSGSATQVMLN